MVFHKGVERLKEPKLKPCPFCGQKVKLALVGDFKESCYWLIHHDSPKGKCRMFMESELFDITDKEAKFSEKEKLVDRWNCRNKPPEPVYKPKLGEYYYVPWCKLAYKWTGNIQDNIFLKAGMVCRTRQEIEPLWSVICKAVKEYRKESQND